MKKTIPLFLFLILCQSTISLAQNHDQEKAKPTAYLGIGTGLDYGGLGIKIEYQPIKYVGLTASIGFNLQGLGINLGTSFYPLPDKKLQPLVSLLYGYNAVIINTDMSEYNKTYYGISPGIGGALKTGKKGNKLYLAIFRPLRNQSFKDDYEAMKNNPSIKIEQDILPVTLSIGFNWVI